MQQKDSINLTMNNLVRSSTGRTLTPPGKRPLRVTKIRSFFEGFVDGQVERWSLHLSGSMGICLQKVQIHPLEKTKRLKMMRKKKSNLSHVVTLAGCAGMIAAMGSSADATTVAYWKFDNGSLTSASVGGPTFDLTNNGYTESAVNLVDPVPNPDGAVGAANNGSIFANGAGSQSLIAGVGSTDPLALNGNSWTFEGWFEADNVARSLDPIFTTRGGQSGDGVLFDIRNNADASAARLNLFVADGGSNTGAHYTTKFERGCLRTRSKNSANSLASFTGASKIRLRFSKPRRKMLLAR